MFNQLISGISQSFGISPWLICLVVIIATLYVYGTWNYSRLQQIGVIGPKPWPLVGSSYFLMKEGFRMDLKMIKKYGRVFGYYEGVTPVVVVADPEYIKAITVKYFDHFTDHRKILFNKRLNGLVFNIKGEDWKIVRNVMTPTFSSGKMKKIAVTITECSDKLVENMNKYAMSGEMFEIREPIGSYGIDLVAETLFGIKVDSQANNENDFVKNAKKTFNELTFGNPVLIMTFFFPFLIDVFEFFDIGTLSKESICFFYDTVQSIVAMRKNMKEVSIAYYEEFFYDKFDLNIKVQRESTFFFFKKPVDFLQLLLDAHSDDSYEIDEKLSSFEESVNDTKQWKSLKRALTENEIVSNSLLFFLAGYETTASAVSWMMYNLALDEEVQEKLYTEVINTLERHNIDKPNYEVISKLNYLDQVYCESLRLFAPTSRTDRLCTKDCDVGPYRFKKGDVINLSILGVHLDEEFWPEPNKFDPERFSPENRNNIVPFTYMPFGLGPRNCIGLRLAGLEAKIAMVQIIKNFKIKRCEKTEVKNK